MVLINGVKIENDTFPNGETNFKTFNLSNFGLKAWITLKYENDMDLFTLQMYSKHLDEIGCDYKTLEIKYFPYSRMDRKIKGQLFSLKYIAQLINDLNFTMVVITDPHSSVTPALLNRCVVADISTNIRKIKDEIDCVFYPDNGAYKRYTECLDLPYTSFYGNKKRNLSNGQIESLELVNIPSETSGKTVLIIDDLCSFGGTFIKSAKALKEAGFERVILYVTHCENNIFKGDIFKTDYIDKVYTTDSLVLHEKNERLVVLSDE